ncbi:MAG: hypothetical protein AAFR04_05285 [Pseudomonadota bacterium]
MGLIMELTAAWITLALLVAMWASMRGQDAMRALIIAALLSPVVGALYVAWRGRQT